MIELDDSRPYEAARHLQKALELGLKMPTLTNLGQAHSNIGEDYQNVSELEKATGFLTQAYALEPSDVILKKLIRAATLAYMLEGRTSAKEQSVALRAEAIKWLDIGIAKDLPSAYQNYGAILHYEGNVAEAITWFSKANDRNVPEAAYAMGLIYQKGQGGVAKDEAQALHWFKIAAKGGMSDARREVVDILDHRLNNTYEMTNTELQAVIDDFEVYVEGFASFNLGSAKKDLLIRRTVEENLQHVQPLPSGIIKFHPCKTDVPTWGAWRIVVLRKPLDEPLELESVVEGVVEGDAYKHGCVNVSRKGLDLLKQSLAAGYTLAWVDPLGVSLLMLKQPWRPGALELVFGPRIEGSE
jgi:TPR repeat protein